MFQAPALRLFGFSVRQLGGHRVKEKGSQSGLRLKAKKAFAALQLDLHR